MNFDTFVRNVHWPCINPFKKSASKHNLSELTRTGCHSLEVYPENECKVNRKLGHVNILMCVLPNWIPWLESHYHSTKSPSVLHELTSVVIPTNCNSLLHLVAVYFLLLFQCFHMWHKSIFLKISQHTFHCPIQQNTTNSELLHLSS